MRVTTVARAVVKVLNLIQFLYCCSSFLVIVFLLLNPKLHTHRSVIIFMRVWAVNMGAVKYNLLSFVYGLIN